jgi:hypothetical protein
MPLLEIAECRPFARSSEVASHNGADVDTGANRGIGRVGNWRGLGALENNDVDLLPLMFPKLLIEAMFTTTLFSNATCTKESSEEAGKNISVLGVSASLQSQPALKGAR